MNSVRIWIWNTFVYFEVNDMTNRLVNAALSLSRYAFEKGTCTNYLWSKDKQIRITAKSRFTSRPSRDYHVFTRMLLNYVDIVDSDSRCIHRNIWPVPLCIALTHKQQQMRTRDISLQIAKWLINLRLRTN